MRLVRVELPLTYSLHHRMAGLRQTPRKTVKWLIPLLVGFSTSMAWSQEKFVCGWEGPPEVPDGWAVGATRHPNEDHYRRGTIRPVVLFGKFKGATNTTLTDIRFTDREGDKNQSVDKLLSATHKGSLGHFMHEMSDGLLTLESGGIHTSWVESQSGSVTHYVGANCADGWSKGVLKFVKEVIRNAETSVDFNSARYDRKPDGTR